MAKFGKFVSKIAENFFAFYQLCLLFIVMVIVPVAVTYFSMKSLWN